MIKEIALDLKVRVEDEYAVSPDELTISPRTYARLIRELRPYIIGDVGPDPVWIGPRLYGMSVKVKEGRRLSVEVSALNGRYNASVQGKHA